MLDDTVPVFKGWTTMQKLIVFLLCVIIVLIAPWMLAVIFAGALAYGAWLLIVGIVVVVLVAAHTFKNSEWRRQRRIRSLVESANRRNSSRADD